MAHMKRHGPGPVPPGNRPSAGPARSENVAQQGNAEAGGGAPLQEHDPKQRIGGFEGAGEHARQQPSQINDGEQRSR
jgi:hypothetical protein